MKILVASTMCTFAVKHPDHRLSQSWLAPLDTPAGVTLRYFAALELDPGGAMDPFWSVIRSIEAKPVSDWWWYTLADGRTSITTANRLHHICAGRNLIQDYAVGNGFDWILFLDADMEPPRDALTKLLDLDWPIVGGHVPTYALSGPSVDRRLQYEGRKPYPDSWDVQVHMNTAGFLLVRRDVFRYNRWRTDPDEGMTDDPCYYADAAALGYPTFVRHDCVGRHYPEAIPPLEDRGYDLSITR